MSQVDAIPMEPSRKVREWLVYDEKPAKDARPPIRVAASTSNRNGKNSITFDDLTEKEADAVRAFLNGTSFIRCVNGRLHAYSALEPLPDPESDPICGPHWRSDGTVKQWGGIPDGEGWHSPGLVLTGLSAGITDGLGADAARARNQRIVIECGFTCMRSPRSDCGRYWEQWVLHGAYCAKGPLKTHMEKLKEQGLDWHQTANAMCNFMVNDMRINFGSLDITIQRWALTYD